MEAEQIKQLREELKCTARELATTLELDQKTVLAWEKGDLFPTKKHVDRMEALRKEGPSAIVKKPIGKRAKKTPMALLDDARLWTIVRKLLAHPELFAKVEKLSEEFEDPAKTEKS